MDNLLTPQELAERLQIGVSWIYERSRRDEILGMVRVGRYIRFHEPTIDKAINEGGSLLRADAINQSNGEG